MPKPIFDTKALTVAEILGNNKVYNVPQFQRSYSWDIEQWEDLWLDILELKKNEENIHYLGTIVLKSDDNKNFEVIDGQQRLATLSFIILACIKKLDEFAQNGIDKEKNLERKELFLNSYIGFKEAKSLTYKPKLILSNVDKDIYNSYLIRLKKPANLQRLTDSNRLMVRSFEYFSKKIEELNFSNGEAVVDFVDNILLNRLVLIQIVVEDTLSAYTVFETLNARGIELTTTDLLKNYLFSLLNERIDIDNLIPLWDRVVNIVTYREFPTFLRYYLNSRQELIRNERLFKEIKNKIQNRENVFELMDNLEKNAEAYVAFDDPEHEFWQEQKNIQRLISELYLFGVKQHKSLLLSVYNNLDLEVFEKVLRLVKAITFRYNVIGKFNPNELELAYNKTAIKIYNSLIRTPSQIQNELNSVYINDEKFINLFITKSFEPQKTKEKKLVRYILLSLENQMYNKNYHPFESDASIEHIIPISDANLNQELLEKLNSLGNLTLLEPKLNREAANKSFSEKIEIYKKSQFNMTKAIAERWSAFDLEKVKIRVRELAEVAKAIWKADY